jgi:hypothetical protein
MTEPTLFGRSINEVLDNLEDLFDSGAVEDEAAAELFAALRWQRWQIDRYRKLQTKTTECAMEALRDRDDALMKLEHLGAKP